MSLEIDKGVIKNGATKSKFVAACSTEKKQKWNMKRNWPLHALVMPAIIFAIIFNYIPLGGIIMAFQDFKPWHGFSNSEWVGLENFRRIFEFQEGRQVIWNTLVISTFKIIFQLIVPIMFALLLNEVRIMAYKRSIQIACLFATFSIMGNLRRNFTRPTFG